MSEDQFTKIFNHMQSEFGKVHARLDDMATKQQFEYLIEMVDGIAKVVEDDQTERAALTQQVGRVEDDVRALQKHLGLAQS
ncbi:hypothetical protein ACPXCE_09220 [Streptomyces sp. DT24]|uniref:hypothetical protein n=1 Tax=unclassified Streptomyces TaxID=2593676 RepID=UPI0023BA1B6E|nr:hypothetical protein [Streptomyces sp. AM 4-1-1]WEH33619.1 hypothetical protein PZB75_09680 [Streptomyces sp. AM 4-1-1]